MFTDCLKTAGMLFLKGQFTQKRCLQTCVFEERLVCFCVNCRFKTRQEAEFVPEAESGLSQAFALHLRLFLQL